MNGPTINPCGAVVEVLRSCFKGSWRMYPRSPEVVTPGYFYFVDPKSRYLGVPSPFFSDCWTVGDVPRGSNYGPVKDAPRQWINGDLGFFPPSGQPVGGEAKIANGADFPTDVNAAGNRGGIPLTCWTQFRLPFAPVNVPFSLQDCCLQRAYARITELLYEEDFATLSTFFASWLGPGAAVVPVPQVGLVPAGVVVQSNAYSLVFVSGTTSYQQFALQAATGIVPPVDVGDFSTQPLYFATSNVYLDAMNAAGVDGATPILFAGHSYGGAVAAVLAARARIGNPQRQIALMTFGMPKCLDERGVSLLRGVGLRHITNRGDIVSLFPPDVLALGALSLAAILLFQAAFPQWKEFPEYQFNWPDGRRTYGPLYEDRPPTWDGFLTDLANHIVIGPITEHMIAEYIRRIGLRCSCPNTLIDAASWRILFPLPNAAEGGIAVGQVVADEVRRLADGGIRWATLEQVPPGSGRGGVRVGGGRQPIPLKASQGVRLGK